MWESNSNWLGYISRALCMVYVAKILNATPSMEYPHIVRAAQVPYKCVCVCMYL